MRKGSILIHKQHGLRVKAISDPVREEWADEEIVWVNLLEPWGEVPTGSTRIFAATELTLTEEKAA